MIQRTNNAPAGANSNGRADWRAMVDVQVPVVDSEGNEMLIPVSDHPALKKYATINDLVVGFINAQKLIGKKQIANEGKYGMRPERPEEYRFELPQLPDGYDPHAGMLPHFLQVAHAAGLTDKQVQAMITYLADLEVVCREHSQETLAHQVQQGLQGLQREWGEEFRQKVDLGERFLHSIADKGEVEYLESLGALDDPCVIRLLAKAGAALAEDFMHGGNAEYGNEKLTRAQLEKMLMDPRYADPDKRDSAFVRRVEQGFQALCRK